MARFSSVRGPAFNPAETAGAVFAEPDGARISHPRAKGTAHRAFLGYKGILAGDSTLAAERAADRIADRFVDTYVAVGE